MVFILSDLLTAPARGLGFVFESVHDAVEEEIEEEKKRMRRALRELHGQLEAGEIDEEEFEEAETDILERLDELDQMLDS